MAELEGSLTPAFSRNLGAEHGEWVLLQLNQLPLLKPSGNYTRRFASRFASQNEKTVRDRPAMAVAQAGPEVDGSLRTCDQRLAHAHPLIETAAGQSQ